MLKYRVQEARECSFYLIERVEVFQKKRTRRSDIKSFSFFNSKIEKSFLFLQL